ncbi:MAG: hypothetical protein HC850_09890 [Rhodomicrobium sp.]|nr:hypothetical protein [Rhodomicrobium sp.]
MTSAFEFARGATRGQRQYQEDYCEFIPIENETARPTFKEANKAERGV